MGLNFSDPGYAVVWDNVGKMVTRRQQGTDKGNYYLQCAMTFLHKNRISFRDLPDEPKKDATTIPLSAFLPSAKDFSTLRSRMVILVSRILATHFPFLKV